MERRSAFTPPWYVWLGGSLLAAGLLLRHPPAQLSGYGIVLALGALAAVVGVVWFLWHVDASYGLVAALCLTSFSGNWAALGLTGFPLVPDRLLLALTAIAVVVRAPGARDRPRMVWRPEHLLLGLTLLYVVASAAWAGTLGTRTAIFAAIDQLGVAPFALFLLAPLVFRDERRRNVLLMGLLCLGTYLSLTAIFEVLGPRALVFPRYIADPSYGLQFGRARGPFDEAVTDGFAMFACGVAAVIVRQTWPSRAIRRWATLLLPLCALGCLLTLERAVWIAVVLGAVAGMLTTRELRRRVVPVVLVGLLAVGAVYVAVPGISSRASQRVADRLPVWDRQNQTAAGLRMLQDKPVLGFGWRTFQRDSQPYFLQAPTYPLTGSQTVLHNVFLLNLVELGLLGTAIWLAAVAACIGGAIVRRGPPQLQPWHSGLAAIAVFWLVVVLFNPLQQTFSELLLWTWAGIVAGGAWRARGTAPDDAGASAVASSV
ncbi:MAG TPA: O-antigen ligase family protein [Conexibacter sp.]|jgi:putative inorganic carbon (HCO3(-)) transporter|nr:O-antigen ligase family protein [Conexibacter sp.]